MILRNPIGEKATEQRLFNFRKANHELDEAVLRVNLAQIINANQKSLQT